MYTKKLDIMSNSLESYMVPDYFEYISKSTQKRIDRETSFDENTKILFDKNTKRKMLKDEEADIREYGPIIEQRLKRYMNLTKIFMIKLR